MSSTKKRRDLNRAIEEHKTARLSAQFATSNHTMLNIVESILAKDNEALRAQIAELTRTNLAQAAQIDELNSVIGHAKQMEAMDKKTLAAQAAQIEAYLTVLERIAKLGNEPHYGNSLGNEIARKALSITPSQALADFAAKVRKQCAVICDGLQHQRNKYIEEDGAEGKPFVPRDCAEAIRNLKEIPK